MYSYKRLRRLAALSPAAGAVLFTGCLGRLTQELDILLSPAASSNALGLSSSFVAPLIEFFLKTFRV